MYIIILHSVRMIRPAPVQEITVRKWKIFLINYLLLGSELVSKNKTLDIIKICFGNLNLDPQLQASDFVHGIAKPHCKADVYQSQRRSS